MTLVDRTNEGAATGPATLRTILDALGIDLLHVLMAPEGLDVAVAGTSIHDPADPMPDGEGRVLLLVGTKVDSPEAPAIVRAAAEHGHVAAVVKTREGDASALVAEASLHGLAILETADDLPWRHLDGLLVSVLGARRLSAGLTTSGGEALFVLANALGGTIGGSIAIEDLQQHVLAYSSIEGQKIDPLRERGILDRQVPDYPHHRAQYLQVLRDSGVSRFPALETEFPRAAVAIRAGDMPLGTIWAIEDDRGLDPAGEQALLEGARIAAMHMLRDQDLTEREQRLRGEVLRSLLVGGRPIDDAEEKLGLTAGSEIYLIAFAFLDMDQQGPLLTQIGVAAARHVLAYRPEAVTTTTTRGAYVLVPGSGEAAHRLASGALRGLQQATGSAVWAAVSAVTRDVRDIPAMRAETDAVLRAAATDDRAPSVATVADVHSRILLDRVARELARDPRLQHPGIRQMVEHDQQHNTSYARSVLTWLDCQGDVGAAATRLQVHANTLRYRLRRAEGRFALDLEDPDTRLSMWLQLRLDQQGSHG